MKKKIALLSLVLTFLLSFSVSAKTIEFMIGSTNFYVDDNKTVTKKEIEIAPFTENGRTLVPVRFIAENLGNAEVLWDESSKTVTIKKDDTEIKLTLDKDIAYINGKDVKLDVPAKELNGRTLVSVRFINKALNFSVEYLEGTKQIMITDEAPVMTLGDSKLYLNEFKSCILPYKGTIPKGQEMPFIFSLTEFLKQTILFNNEALKNNINIDEKLKNDTLIYYKNANDNIYKFVLGSSQYKLLNMTQHAQKYVSDLEYKKLSDEEINDIYNKNYVNAKHILISTVDMKTGKPYDEKDKKKSEEKAKLILSRVNKGEDFDKLMAEFSEDPGSKTYPNGYVFTKGEMVKEFEDSAFSLEVGKISDIVESPYGYHIIKKEPLPEKISDNIKSFILNKAKEVEFKTKYDEMLKNADLKMNLSNEQIAELVEFVK